MKYLIQKYRFVLLPIASGSIIVLMTIFFVMPKIKMMVETKQALKLQKEKLSRLTEKISFLESLDEYVLEKKVVGIERALPSKKAVAEILATLSSLSSESGASFVNLKISPGELSVSAFEKVEFRATFEGELANIKEMLRKISQATPIMKVTAFSVRKNKAILKIEGYFSSVPESLGEIDAPSPQISERERKIYEEITQFTTYKEALPEVSVGKEDFFSGF